MMAQATNVPPCFSWIRKSRIRYSKVIVCHFKKQRQVNRVWDLVQAAQNGASEQKQIPSGQSKS